MPSDREVEAAAKVYLNAKSYQAPPETIAANLAKEMLSAAATARPDWEAIAHGLAVDGRGIYPMSSRADWKHYGEAFKAYKRAALGEGSGEESQ